MAQKNLKWDDAMARVHQEKSARKSNGYASDEGVADIGSPSREESSPQPDESSDDVDMPDAESVDPASSQRYISSMEVKARLMELFKKEQEVLALLYNAKPPTRSSPMVTPDMFSRDLHSRPTQSLPT